MIRIMLSTLLFFTFAVGASHGTINEKHSSASKSLNRHSILRTFNKWGGVRYKLGGSGKSGIDCSALVQKILSEFDISFPRTSSEQLRSGIHVKRTELIAGDLVFFKMSERQQHVGIYIGYNEFIHASTSSGVIISSLKNRYWDTRYQAGIHISN